MAMTSLKYVLVTGGNSGLGYETVKALLKSNNAYHVFLTSRSEDKARLAIESLKEQCPGTTNTVETIQLDVTSDESIQKAFDHVKAKPGHLDTLINNAGATFDLEFVAGKVTLRKCFNKAYDANVTGATIMTSTFMPLLLKSSDPRLIFVAGLSHMTLAARQYFPTPPQPAGWPKNIGFETIGYRCSKTALNMLMLDWSHKLKEDGVKVWSVLPCLLATNLGGVPEMAKAIGAQHPSIGGNVLLDVVEGKRDDVVGNLINKDGLGVF